MKRALGVVIGAIPFAFGILRAMQTGSDFRYLWVALASTLGAVVVWFLAKDRASLLIRTLAVLVASMVLSCAVAMMLGTRLALGLVTVAAGFAVCTTAGYHILAHFPSRRGDTAST